MRYLICIGLLATLALGCGQSEQKNNQPDTCKGKCDGINNSEGFAELDDLNDPAATYLKTQVDQYGAITGDYRQVLAGVGEQMGCDETQQKTFTILLSNKSNFPRNIVTHCSDSPRKASSFFLSTQSDDGALGDINARDFKIAAWDNDTDRYNLYEIKAEDGPDKPMTVYVNPPQCMTCHGAASNLDAPEVAFTPIMNELTNPWTLWNAEPEFRSHRFDDLLNPMVKDAPIYSEMVAGDRLGSASDFETIMRSALDRVAKARYDERKLPANLDQSLALLRPMFCDEVVNYASENHESNQIQSNALVDASIANMFVDLKGTDWPYDFVFEDRVRFGDVDNDDEYIAVIPVRGDAMVAYEKRLVSRKILSAMQILRLRALDWQRPVFSEFRCGLYTNNVARLKASPPASDGYDTNADWMPVLFEELMKVSVDDQLVHLKPAEEGQLLSVPQVDEADVAELSAQNWDAYLVSVDGFGEAVDLYIADFKSGNQRPALEPERKRRGCYARLYYASAPDIPNLGDCN